MPPSGTPARHEAVPGRGLSRSSTTSSDSSAPPLTSTRVPAPQTIHTATGAAAPSQPPAPAGFATTSQIEDFDAKMASTASFLWLVSTGNDRVTQVNAGRAYARVQLAGTAYGVVMQPLSQALQEYAEQAGPYAAIHSLLDAPQPAQTVQMWARVGFAPPVEPAPRRGLDAHIMRT